VKIKKKELYECHPRSATIARKWRERYQTYVQGHNFVWPFWRETRKL